MEIENVLEKLGFSPNEIKVYLTLNDHGSTKAGRISKLAKIDRSSGYNSLKSLRPYNGAKELNINCFHCFKGISSRSSFSEGKFSIFFDSGIERNLPHVSNLLP